MPKILAVASAGGHFEELIRLQPLLERASQARIITQKSKRTLDFATQNPNIPVQYTGKFKAKNRLTYAFGFLVNLIEEFSQTWRFKPDVIISTGSQVAIPVFLYGRLFGKKVYYIESIARVTSKSLAGKIAQKLGVQIIVQWPEMVDVYGGKAIYQGSLL